MKSTWLIDNIKPILAIMIVTMGFSYFFMCSIRNLKPDPQILIAFVSSIGVCIGYYFGSSQGSSKKDEMLSTNQDKPVVTNADVVNVAPVDEKS